MSDDKVATPPLKTEEEYEKALAEVKTLLNAKSDTPEGARLIALTACIRNYERIRYTPEDDDGDEFDDDPRVRKPKGKKLLTFRKNAF